MTIFCICSPSTDLSKIEGLETQIHSPIQKLTKMLYHHSSIISCRLTTLYKAVVIHMYATHLINKNIPKCFEVCLFSGTKAKTNKQLFYLIWQLKKSRLLHKSRGCCVRIQGFSRKQLPMLKQVPAYHRNDKFIVYYNILIPDI